MLPRRFFNFRLKTTNILQSYLNFLGSFVFMGLRVSLFCCVLLMNLVVLGQDRPVIVQRPITWNAERETLSIAYLKNRHGLDSRRAEITPKIIVVHWTDVLSVDKTFKTFDPVQLPARPNLQKASMLNVSSQFLIGRDGTIFQLLPETTFARHTIGLNYCAIGIENVGSARHPLTEEQLSANTALIKYLMAKYPISYVIGHHEYQSFKSTSWWKETDPTYITHKDDPGASFMMRLRKALGLHEQLSSR